MLLYGKAVSCRIFPTSEHLCQTSRSNRVQEGVLFSESAMNGTRRTEQVPSTFDYCDFVSILELYHLIASDQSLVDDCAIGGQVSQEYADLTVADYPVYQAVTIGYMFVINDQVFEKSRAVRRIGSKQDVIRLTAFRVTANNVPLRLGSWKALMTVCQINSAQTGLIHRKQTAP